MFKLATEPTFRHKLRARVPVNGGHQEESFEVTYRVLTVEQIAEFDLVNADAERTGDFLRRVIVELHDISDAQGNPVEYSDEVRDAVLNLPYARSAIVQGYFDGVAGARKGN